MALIEDRLFDWWAQRIGDVYSLVYEAIGELRMLRADTDNNDKNTLTLRLEREQLLDKIEQLNVEIYNLKLALEIVKNVLKLDGRVSTLNKIDAILEENSR